jgi:acyl-CoA synthetase (AMP-forming)/AMP-acid ligase II
VKSHPAVFDCTVVGAPDPRWGEQVTAIVELRPGAQATLEDVQQHCRTKIAGYKIPKRLCIVERLVRSPSGKPDYRWAKDVATSS